MVNVVLRSKIGISVNLGRGMFFEIRSALHRVADKRLLLALSRMAPDHAVYGVEVFYRRVNAVVHSAGLRCPLMRLCERHCRRHLGPVLGAKMMLDEMTEVYDRIYSCKELMEWEEEMGLPMLYMDVYSCRLPRRSHFPSTLPHSRCLAYPPSDRHAEVFT